MKLHLKSLVAAAALAVVAGHASASIQQPIVTPAGSELVFFAWDDVTNTSYEKDLGIVFSNFLPSSTTTSASNFSQSVAGSAWTAYVQSVGNNLSNTKWGVIGTVKGPSLTNGGQKLATTMAVGGSNATQTSGVLKTAIAAMQNNIQAIDAIDTSAVAVNNNYFSNSTGFENWATGVQHNNFGNLVFNMDNAIGTDSSFNLLSASGTTSVLSTNSTYAGIMSFNGSNVSYSVAQVAPVPEPSSYAMLVAGLMLVGGIAARRRNS